MRRIIINLFAFTLLFASVACAGRSAVSPTPFPTAGPSPTSGSTGPIVLTVTELMNAPGLYKDSVVQVSGLLRKQPLLVCDAEPNPSPAGWGLAEEGLLALAGGFEQQVRSLLPDDLTMTVEGRWRQWTGLVGCGKEAVQQEVWYLEASRILSPSPLTQVTLTPSSGIDIAAITSTPEGASATESVDLIPTTSPEETPAEPVSTAGSAALASPTVDPFAPLPTNTLTAFETPLITPLASATLAAGTTVTPGAGLTTTPGGTAEPTASGTPPTPTPTATTGSSSGQVVTKGYFFDETFGDYVVTSLAGGSIDSWLIDVFEDESVYIYAIAPSPADIILSILKDGQPIVNRQNTAPAGSPEAITNPTLQGEGEYEIQVLTVNSVSTEYALALTTDPETPVSIPGMVLSGSPRSAVQLPAFGYHYWFFVASAGDEISITLTPLGNEDAGIYVYDPTGEELAYADDGFEGEEEFIEATVTISGLHAINIEELYGDPMQYDLLLTIE